MDTVQIFGREGGGGELVLQMYFSLSIGNNAGIRKFSLGGKSFATVGRF